MNHFRGAGARQTLGEGIIRLPTNSKRIDGI